MSDLAPGKRKYNFYQKTYKKFPDLTLTKAKEVGDKIGIDWSEIDLGEFRQGVKEEMEHGTMYGKATTVHPDSYHVAGQIALAHLIEVADYYQLLERMEHKAEKRWGEGPEEKTKRKAWIASNYIEEAEALKAEGITDLPAAA